MAEANRSTQDETMRALERAAATGDATAAARLAAAQERAKTPVRRAYEEAHGAWECADWTHDYRRDGRVVVERDSEGEPLGPLYCSGGNYEDCSVCAESREAIETAERCGLAAVEAAERGDWDTALEEAREAQRAEAEFGDSPTWGPFARAVEESAPSGDEEQGS